MRITFLVALALGLLCVACKGPHKCTGCVCTQYIKPKDIEGEWPWRVDSVQMCCDPVFGATYTVWQGQVHWIGRHEDAPKAMYPNRNRFSKYTDLLRLDERGRPDSQAPLDTFHVIAFNICERELSTGNYPAFED